MKNIKLILDEVLKEVQPDKKYEKEIFEKLNFIIKKINENQKNVRVVLGGSGAKGTWLKTFDADIFALFDYKKFKGKSEELSNMLNKILKNKFKNVIRLHGSRDYFQIKQGNFTFEIVPILKIQKPAQARNITDFSPLHSKWVSRYKWLVDEIKLTKQFCKAQRVYGAESYIKGFSGYVCEILTIHYGSFLNLIKNSAKWDDKVIIDAQKYYKGRSALKLINASKLESPLIVVDPVQKERNASAALGVDKFEKFKSSSKNFLKNPSKNFFIKKDLSISFLKQKYSNKLIALKVKPLNGKMDIVGSKLLKVYEFLNEELKKHSFKVVKADWELDKNGAVFYFLLGIEKLPKHLEIAGPPLRIKEHVENFKRLYKNTFTKSGRIFALKERKFLHPEGLIKNLLKRQFVRERAKSIKFSVI